MDAKDIADAKRVTECCSCGLPQLALEYIEELEQRLSLRDELAADPEMVAGMKRGLAYLRDYDKIVSELREPLWYAIEYIEELEQQLTYQTDRAESFCTRLHEEEHRNAELRQRCETMSAYLRTHDQRLHDAAMAAARYSNTEGLRDA